MIGKNKVLSQIVKQSDELDATFYVKKVTQAKIDNGHRNACFWTKNYLVFVKEIRGKDIICNGYKKSKLTTFFNVFNIDSRELDIFLLKTTLHPDHITVEKVDLLKKMCCCYS